MVLELEVVLAILAVVWIASGFSSGSDHWLTREHMEDIN